MLAPTQLQLCLLLSSQSKGWGVSTYAGTSGCFFLFVPSLLPTVMDPSSLIRVFFLGFFFCTFYKIFSHRHATLHICQVVWIPDSFVVPTLVYNQALREGVNVCEHHKCFILPMHRLGCLKERLLYSVLALVCAISHEFLCLPHCWRFLQYPLTSPREVWGGGVRKKHCTDCCKKSEWIWLIVYVWVPCSVFSCMQSVFFFELTQIIEGESFVEVALMEIPQCTWLPLEATAAKLCVYNRWSVLQACTQKWPLNGHTWPTFKCCSF